MTKNSIRETCCLDMNGCECCPFRELCQIVSIQDDEMPFGDIIDKLNEVIKDINEEMED